MGGTNSETAGRRYRRACRLRHERHGVVAVIGTLLALLVFFALFGIFLTQYVPLWMTDNESLLTAQASTSFASFKGFVDAQYVFGGPQSFGTPFVISSQSVPLIAQPTEGTLVFLPNTCPGGLYSLGTIPVGAGADLGQPINPAYCVFANYTESVGPGGVTNYAQQIQTGVLELNLPNRYYTPETFFYEDDGVVQSQSSGYQVMAFPPPLNVTVAGTNTTVSDSFLQLYGNASTVFGQGSEMVYSHLKFTQLVTSNGGVSGTPTPFKFTFEIGTQYPCAWDPFLYHLLTNSGISPSNYRLANNFTSGNPATLKETTLLSSTYTASSCFNSNGATTILSFSLLNVNYAQVYQAGVQVGLGVGST
jgi:hypothetical protein